jgi:hypothetical protein
MGKVKGDSEAQLQKDQYMYHYANAHGAKAWKSLPAINKLHGTVDYIQQHHLLDPTSLNAFVQETKYMKTEHDLSQFVDTIWQATGIGEFVKTWKSIVKDTTPQPGVAPANK